MSASLIWLTVCCLEWMLQSIECILCDILTSENLPQDLLLCNVIHVIVSVLILYLFSTTSNMNGTV